MSAIRFDTLKHRTTLTARLEAETAFRVGAGKSLDAVTTDLPVLRAGGESFLVPGSSLKGLFRSSSEQLLRACAPVGQERKFACDLFAKDESGREIACWAIPQDLKDKWDEWKVADRVKATREHLEQNMCRACATFGAQGWAAVARFSDAMVKGASVTVRDGVGLDRDLGRAADRIKYDYEVINPGAWFELRIALENALDWQIGLLLAALDQIDDGAVRIGGFGSRGLGWFSVHDKKIVRRDLTAVLSGTGGELMSEESCRSALSRELHSGASEVL